MTVRIYPQPATAPIAVGMRVIYPALSAQPATVRRVIPLADGDALLALAYCPPLRWKDGTTQAHADALAREVTVVEGGER